MDLNELKIKSKDFTGKDVASLPVHPSANGMSAEELQAAFDRSVKEVIAPKVNSLIDAVAAIQVGGVTPDGELLTSEKIVHSVAGTPTGGTVSDYLAQSMAHQSNYNNPHRVTKSTIGLSNVDNTSDANKPLSIAAKQAIDKLATKDEVALKADKSALDEFGGGRKFANIVVGTRTAGWTKKDCDYLCDGASDNVEFQAAVNDCANFGTIHVLPGDYNFSATVSTNGKRLTFKGTCFSTIYSSQPLMTLFKMPFGDAVVDGLAFASANSLSISTEPIFFETKDGNIFFKNIFILPGKTTSTRMGGTLFKSIGRTNIQIQNCYLRNARFINYQSGPGGALNIISSAIVFQGNNFNVDAPLYVTGSSLNGSMTITCSKKVNLAGSVLDGISINCKTIEMIGSSASTINATGDAYVAGSIVRQITAGGRLNKDGVIYL